MNAGGRPRVRRRWIAFAAAIVLVAAVILSRPRWLPGIGQFLVVADPLQPADALVPLGGGRGRVVRAASLHGEGYAPWLVAPNMPLNVPGVDESYAELVRKEAVSYGVPHERVVIMPGTVETTYQEALAVRKMASAQGWDSLLIVTDPFHTRRARLSFRRAFRNTNVTLIVRPVEPSWYDPDTWWQSRDGLRETWTEYLKLALFMLGYG